jgi:epoxide hydrolase-like predicted phosphatase
VLGPHPNPFHLKPYTFHLKPLKMIKAIIFDLGGVLMTDVPLIQIAEELAKKSPLSKDEIHAHLYPTEHWTFLTLGKITEDEYWDNFLKVSKISEKLEVRSEKLKKEFKKKVRSSLYPLKHASKIVNLLKNHSFDYAQDLRYKLAILSNHAKEWSEYMKRKFDLFKSFDQIIFSYDIGLRKPDPKIYKVALERLQCDAGECVFIDDKKRNTDAAEKLGMKGIVFEEPSKLLEELVRLGVRSGSTVRSGGPIKGT